MRTRDHVGHTTRILILMLFAFISPQSYGKMCVAYGNASNSGGDIYVTSPDGIRRNIGRINTWGWYAPYDFVSSSNPSPYSGVIDSYKVSLNFAIPDSLYAEPSGAAASFQAAIQKTGEGVFGTAKTDVIPGELQGKLTGVKPIPQGYSTNLNINGYMTYNAGQVMVCSDTPDITFPESIDGTITAHLYNQRVPQAGITFNAATRWYRKSTSLNVSWSPSTIDITGKAGESGTASSDLTVAAQTGYYGPVDVRFEYASAPCPAEIVVRDSSGEVNASLSTPGGVRFKLDVPYNSPVSHRYNFTATAPRATTGTCNLNATLTLP